MRIAITGASGHVGQQILPLLQARGAELLLIGRDPQKLSELYPGVASATYDDLAQAAGFDMLLHLAVVNNDQKLEIADVNRVNVDLAIDMSRQAQRLGISRFVIPSSVHALDPTNLSTYARSKREAVKRLGETSGIGCVVLYLPAVIGRRLAGKLALVNRLPRPLRAAILPVLASLKPTLHADRLVEVLIDLAKGQRIEETGGQHILSDGQADNSVFHLIKRFIDCGFALAVILLFWWAMAAVWVAIRLQSPGPGIFRQQRVGRNEKVFTCYKFRTMYVSAPNAGTHEVASSQVTPLGKFLRRTKLDELPQVINLLRNEMSLVGPRPSLPTQLDVMKERRALGVFEVTPGITGLAQVRGIDMSRPADLAASDFEYIRLLSLALDAKIMLKTARGGGSGDRTAEPAGHPLPPDG